MCCSKLIIYIFFEIISMVTPHPPPPLTKHHVNQFNPVFLNNSHLFSIFRLVWDSYLLKRNFSFKIVQHSDKMADAVKLKQRVLKQKQFNVGDCISVSRLYFGSDYTSLLPDYIDRIVGRVIFVYPEAKTVKVHWDIDDTECNVKLRDIYVEDGDLPKQSIPVES